MLDIGQLEVNIINLQTQFKQINLTLKTGETRKAHARRLKEGWYEKYAPSDKSGIDIGCQYDPLNETFRRYDI